MGVVKPTTFLPVVLAACGSAHVRMHWRMRIKVIKNASWIKGSGLVYLQHIKKNLHKKKIMTLYYISSYNNTLDYTCIQKKEEFKSFLSEIKNWSKSSSTVYLH